MIGTWRKKLKQHILDRKNLDQLISAYEETRDKINQRILRIQEEHQKPSIKLGGYESVVIRGQSLTLDEKGILKWYQHRKVPAPIKEVFDVAQFEEDIKNKIVPASILRKYSKVEDRKPYVRITPVKNET